MLLSVKRPTALWQLAILLLILVTGFAPSAGAHVVKQLYGEFHGSNGEWQLNILFDAGYADPATRNDAAAPQPGRDWLVQLSPAGQQQLCAQAESYLKESLSFRSGGAPMEWKVSFPDFKSTPPDFPSLLNDGAYFHALIEAVDAKPGDLVVGMAGGNHPDLVVKMPPVAEESSYLTVPPGGDVELLAGVSSEPPPEPKGAAFVAFTQGVLHVIPKGLDHILFVLGIFFLQRRWRPLLKQSLAFTAAHTITLGLASAGLVNVPGKLVEPVIALSITALAVENLFVTEARPWRLWLVFAFGLIHGLGFAGALSSWIHPGEGFLPALISANLGVETAQVIILLAAWLLTMGWSRGQAWPHFRRWSCVGLALAGMAWFVGRVGWF